MKHVFPILLSLAVATPNTYSQVVDEDQTNLFGVDEVLTFWSNLGNPSTNLQNDYANIETTIGVENSGGGSDGGGGDGGSDSGGDDDGSGDDSGSFFDPDEADENYSTEVCDINGNPIGSGDGGGGTGGDGGGGDGGTGGTGDDGGEPTIADTVTIPFDVVPLDDRNDYMRRQALLQIYVNYADRLETSINDTAEDLAAVELRKMTAKLELFFIYMRLFADANNLPDKCIYVSKASSMLEQITAGANGMGGQVTPEQILAPWQTVADGYNTLSAEFKAAVGKQEACSFSQVASSTDAVETIRTAVDQEIDTVVKAELTQVEQFVIAQQANIVALLQAMEVNINTAGVLELKRDAANVRANLGLVTGDTFGVGPLVASGDLPTDADCATLSSTNRLDPHIYCMKDFLSGGGQSHPKLVELRAKMEELKDISNVTVQTISDLSTIAGLSDTNNYCSNLATFLTKNQSIDTPPTSAEISGVGGLVSGCLGVAKALLVSAQAPDSDDNYYADQFASKLTAFSSKLLELKKWKDVEP